MTAYVGQLATRELRRRLRSDRGLLLGIGPFAIAVRSSLPIVAEGLTSLYEAYPLVADDALIDYQVEVNAPSPLRRWWRPKVNFSFEGTLPFKPLPMCQGFAMFEWGLNWVIANHAHQYCIIHAAVLERDGKAILLPGMPGSGKSTLGAALVCRGWRLLSDEMALISLADGRLHPVPRPVSLKNESIAIVRAFGPQQTFGRTIDDTLKGTVTHMRAPITSVQDANRTALPYAVVFPRYRAQAQLERADLGRGATLIRLAQNCFNYAALGEAGFTAIADLVARAHCLEITYSALDDAIAEIRAL